MTYRYYKEIRIFAMVLAFVFLSVFTALSQNQINPPVKFDAQVMNNQNPQSVVMYWTADRNGMQPTFFVIYKADKETDNLSDFSRFEYVRANLNSLEYKYLLNLQPGFYSFYITAMAIDGNTVIESQPTRIIKVEIKTPDTKPVIKILSQPPTQAFVGVEYNYYLKYDANINCPIDVFQLQGDVPRGMTIIPPGIINFLPTETGEYDLAVMIGTSCKINIEPAVQKFHLSVLKDGQNNGYLKIVSQPPPMGKVGEEWVYQIKAESNVKCPIMFEFKMQPMEGVNFDANTGTLHIMTKVPALYTGTIRAYLQCDTKIQAFQQFVVQFGGDIGQKPCAVIFGTVTYEDGSIPTDGKVTFWSTTKTNDKRNSNMFTVGVKQGSYYLEIPDGSYLGDVNGPFAHEFYQDAETIDKATKIEVACNTKNEINFIVAKPPQPKTFEVTGKVTAEKDGSPLFTVVEFIPVEIMKGLNNDKNSPINTQFMTKTDDQGKYSIKLPNTFTYIAHAMQPVNSDYMEQFFDGVDSPYEADILELTGDLTDINFVLKTKLNTTNGFSGTVKDSLMNPIKARVMAYLIKPADPSFIKKFMQQTETGQDGAYRFSNLIPGDYVVLSIPYDKQFLPGYYKMSDYASLKWKDATKIIVGDAMLDMIFEIKHRQRTGLKGVIRVDGVVSDLSGNIKKSDVPQKNNVGLSGAVVYIFDENGAVSDYSITDQGGAFTMIEVAQGNNKLLVDKPGYVPYQEGVNNDYDKNYSSNFNIGMEKEGTSGAPELNSVFQDYKIYPIPSYGNATIEFNANAGTGRIVICNLIGSELESMNIETLEGLNQFKFNLSSLTSGLYFVKVIIDGKLTVVPMTISR